MSETNTEESKTRSRKEVDSEYTRTAMMMGHRSRMLYQVQIEANKIEEEVKMYLDKLVALNEEGMSLPAEPEPVPHPPIPPAPQNEVAMTEGASA